MGKKITAFFMIMNSFVNKHIIHKNQVHYILYLAYEDPNELSTYFNDDKVKKEGKENIQYILYKYEYINFNNKKGSLMS